MNATMELSAIDYLVSAAKKAGIHALAFALVLGTSIAALQQIKDIRPAITGAMVFAATQEAFGAHRGTSLPVAPPVTCPQGVHAGDGCPGAVGSFQVPGMLTNSTYTQQTYVTRPPWNQVAIDYPDGVDPTVILFDPAITQPANCAYNPTGSAANTPGPLLTCGGGAVDIEGWELGAVGGHLGTVVVINANATSLTFRNNHMLADSNITSAANNNQFSLYVHSISTMPISMVNNSFDGGCLITACTTNLHIGLFSTGAVTIEYNQFKNMPVRIDGGCEDDITGCGTTQGDWTVQWNSLIGFGYNGGIHNEWVLMIMNQVVQATMTNYIWRYNTTVMLPNQPDSGSGGGAPFITGVINAAGGGAPLKPVYLHTYVDHNLMIANLGPNGSNTVADGQFYLANGEFHDVHIETNYFDNTGAGQWTWNGNQSNFVSGGFSAGVLTVASALGPGNFPNWHLINVGQKTWASHADANCVIGTQITGTTGAAGTYNASGGGCAALTNGTAVIGYGLQGDGIVFASSIFGNIDMKTGLASNTVASGQISEISVPMP